MFSVLSGSIDVKSGNAGVRQYVTLERPIGTSKPPQVDRKFLVFASIYDFMNIRRTFRFIVNLYELVVVR